MGNTELRYLANDKPLRALSTPPKQLFQKALEDLVENNPVPDKFEDAQLVGIFIGFTGIAYMLLQLSELHPDVRVKGETLKDLAARYMKADKDAPMLEQDIESGIISEKIGRAALTACLSGAEADVDAFIVTTADSAKKFGPEVQKPPPDEVLYGRAGVLFLLRLVRHWVPSAKEKLDTQMEEVVARTMENNNHGEKSWEWSGRKFAGAVHGDIGIITQIVLSLPHLAPKFEPHIIRLLNLQFEDGNWPKFTDQDEKESDVVQFCHGAPGFIVSLQTLRPYYPHLQDTFDKAIAKGVDITWAKGLLKKEPALCHGILGNAL